MGVLQRKSGNLSQAIQTFQDMGPEALPYLKELLETEPSYVREVYAASFEKLPPPVKRMLPDPSLDAVAIRARAVDVIGKLGIAAEPVIPLLHQAAVDPEAQIRMAAVIALGNLRQLANADTVLVLSAALFDPNPFVRKNACSALGRIGAEARDAIPVLSRCATGGDPDMRLLAIGALGAMGPVAKEALPLLLEVSQVGSETERKIALRAISQIDIPLRVEAGKMSRSNDH